MMQWSYVCTCTCNSLILKHSIMGQSCGSCICVHVVRFVLQIPNAHRALGRLTVSPGFQHQLLEPQTTNHTRAEKLIIMFTEVTNLKSARATQRVNGGKFALVLNQTTHLTTVTIQP